MNAGNLNGKARQMKDWRRRLVALVAALSLLISSCGLTAFAESDEDIYSAPVTAPIAPANTSPEPEEGGAEVTPAPEGQDETGTEPAEETGEETGTEPVEETGEENGTEPGEEGTEGEPEVSEEPEDLTVYESGTLTAEADGIDVTLDYAPEAHISEGAVLTLARATGGDLYSTMKAAARVLKEEVNETWKRELGDEATFYLLTLTTPEGIELHPTDGLTLTCTNLSIPAGFTGFVTGTNAENIDWDGDLTLAFLPDAIGYANLKQVQIGTITLVHNDRDYMVTASYGPEAGFPVGTALKVREIMPGTPEYALYSGMTDEALNEDWSEITLERYFDIAFVKDDVELEPQAEVDVQITFRDKIEENEDTEVAAVHIENNEATVIESETDSQVVAKHDDEAIDTVTFTSDSFSVYGVVQKKKIITKILEAGGQTYEIGVTYTQEAEIPEDAQIKVEEIPEGSDLYNAYKKQTAAALNADDVRLPGLYDISIVDAEGNKVEPKAAVNVAFKLLNDETTEDIQVVHFKEEIPQELVEAEAQLQETAEQTEVQIEPLAEEDKIASEEIQASVEGDAVTFDTDSFSVYAFAYTIVTYYKVASGETYKITLNYDENSGIPTGAELNATEILPGNERYDEYVENAIRAASDKTDENDESEKSLPEIQYVRFFDIEILAGGQKIEPNGNVSVTIELADIHIVDNIELAVVHFANEGTEVIDAQYEDDIIQFDTDSFSVYGVLTYGGNPNVENGMDGKTCYLKHGSQYLTSTVIQDNTADQFKKDTNKNNATLWHFELVPSSNNLYKLYCYDSNGNKKYMSVVYKSGNAADAKMVDDADQATWFEIIEKNGGYKLRGRSKGTDFYLNEWGGGSRSGFAGYGRENDNDDIFTFEFPVVESGKSYMVLVKYKEKYYIVNNDASLTEVGYDVATNSVYVDNPMLWTVEGYNPTKHIYFHSEAAGYQSDMQASDFYRRYLNPSEDDALTEEKSSNVSLDNHWQNRWRDDQGVENYPNTISNRDNILNQTQLSYYDEHIYRDPWGSGKCFGIETDENDIPVRLIGNQPESNLAEFIFADATKVHDPGAWNHMVSHIDISIAGNSKINVPLAYGTYYYKDEGGNYIEYNVLSNTSLELSTPVVIDSEDMKKATIKAYDKNNKEIHNAFKITGYSANAHTNISTVQVRIEGSFKVADLDYSSFDDSIKQARKNNPITYVVSAIKNIPFNMIDPTRGQLYEKQADGSYQPLVVNMDIDMTASFNYYDSNNECPPIQKGWYGSDNNYWEWYNGGIPGGSGMDFVLGGDAEAANSNTVAIEITKQIVDENGRLIHPAEKIIHTMDVYAKDGVTDANTVADLNVEQFRNGTADYTGYKKIHSKNVAVGTSGMTVVYDYAVKPGMYFITEEHDSSSLPTEITDNVGNKWRYKETVIKTEYVRRGNQYDDETLYPNPMHVSKTYTLEHPEAIASSGGYEYASIPEILGTFTTLKFETKKSGILEFFVYNVYVNTSKTSLEVEKDWAAGTSVAKDTEVTVELRYAKRQISNNGTAIATPEAWPAYDQYQPISGEIFDSGLVTTLTLNADQNWKALFTNLPKTWKDSNNNDWEIDYYAVETAVMAGEQNIIGSFVQTTEKEDADSDHADTSDGKVTITNTSGNVEIILKKKDASTGQYISGAKFKLYTEAAYLSGGAPINPLDPAYECNTGNMGTPVLEDEEYVLVSFGEQGNFFHGKLPLGRYYLVEVAPAGGYKKLENDIILELRDVTKNVPGVEGVFVDETGTGEHFEPLTIDNDKHMFYNVYIKNTPIPKTSITVKKDWLGNGTPEEVQLTLRRYRKDSAEPTTAPVTEPDPTETTPPSPVVTLKEDCQLTIVKDGIPEGSNGFNATYTVKKNDETIATIEYSQFSNGSYTLSPLVEGDYTVTELVIGEITGYTRTSDETSSQSILVANNETVTFEGSYEEEDNGDNVRLSMIGTWKDQFGNDIASLPQSGSFTVDVYKRINEQDVKQGEIRLSAPLWTGSISLPKTDEYTQYYIKHHNLTEINAETSYQYDWEGLIGNKAGTFTYNGIVKNSPNTKTINITSTNTINIADVKYIQNGVEKSVTNYISNVQNVTFTVPNTVNNSIAITEYKIKLGYIGQPLNYTISGGASGNGTISGNTDGQTITINATSSQNIVITFTSQSSAIKPLRMLAFAGASSGGTASSDVPEEGYILDTSFTDIIVTLNEENGWDEVYELDQCDANGDAYYYEIVEENVPQGFAVSYSTNNPFKADTAAAATLTAYNTSTAPGEGNLIVYKYISGNAADPTETFEFTVTIKDASDNPISGTFGEMIFNAEGIATFTLSNGDHKTASGLPEGTKFTVSEDARGYYAHRTGDPDGSIVANETKQVIITNMLNTAVEHNSVTVYKTDGTNPLSGATFALYKEEEVDDEEAKPVKVYELGTNTSFEISTDDPVITPLLDENNSVTLKLKETAAPEGYRVSSELYTVVITKTTRAGWNAGNTAWINTTVYGITIDSKAEKTIPNTPVGSISVTKYVTDNGAISNELDDTTFRFGLFAGNDEPDDNAVAIKTGELTIEDNTAHDILFNDLELGPYWVFEIDENDHPIKNESIILINENFYTVNETTSPKVIFTTAGEEKNVSITNNKEGTGNLIVEKILDGDDVDPDKEFHFTVTQTNTPVIPNNTYGENGMRFEDGVARFTLKGGESIEATGLPYGFEYIVEEAEANQDGYTTSYTISSEQDGFVANWFISTGETEHVTYTNMKNKTGSFTVKKEWLSMDPKYTNNMPSVYFTIKYYVPTAIWSDLDENGDPVPNQADSAKIYNGYEDIVLNAACGWTKSFDLPETLYGKPAMYFVEEKLLDEQRQHPEVDCIYPATIPEGLEDKYAIQLMGYASIANGITRESQDTYQRPQDLSIGYEGTFIMRNRAPSQYMQMDIKKKFLEWVPNTDGNGNYSLYTVTHLDRIMKNKIIEIQVMRRFIDETTGNVVSGWQDYGNSIFVGYGPNGEHYEDNNGNAFEVQYVPGTWQWLIPNNKQNTGLPRRGFEVVNDTVTSVRYQYVQREVAVYDGNRVKLNEEWASWLPYAWDPITEGSATHVRLPEVPLYVAQDEDRFLANIPATSLTVKKEWNNETNVDAVYVKIYRTGYEERDFTKELCSQTGIAGIIGPNYFPNGYAGILDKEKKALILSKDNNWTATIHSIEIKNNSLFTIEEIGYSDANGYHEIDVNDNPFNTEYFKISRDTPMGDGLELTTDKDHNKLIVVNSVPSGALKIRKTVTLSDDAQATDKVFYFTVVKDGVYYYLNEDQELATTETAPADVTEPGIIAVTSNGETAAVTLEGLPVGNYTVTEVNPLETITVDENEYVYICTRINATKGLTKEIAVTSGETAEADVNNLYSTPIDIKARKEWVEASGNLRHRPTKLKLTLGATLESGGALNLVEFLGKGEDYLSQIIEPEITDGIQDWTNAIAEWKDLPEYTEDKVKINYSVTESIVEPDDPDKLDYYRLDPPGKDNDTNTIILTNRLVETAVKLYGVKYIEHKDLRQAGFANEIKGFTFTLSAADDTPMPSITTVHADTHIAALVLEGLYDEKYKPIIVFGDIYYTQDDLTLQGDGTYKGVFKYTITEDVPENHDDWVYDNSVYSAVVTVIYDPVNRTFSNDVEYFLGETQVEEFVFVNRKLIDVDVEKKWSIEPPADTEIKLKLSRIINDKEEDVPDADVIILKAADNNGEKNKWHAVWENLPRYEGTNPITYIVREVQKSEAYNVLYDEDVTATYALVVNGKAIVNNVRKVGKVQIKKTFVGYPGGIPEDFIITANWNGLAAPITLKLDPQEQEQVEMNDYSVSIQLVTGEDAQGNPEYTWTIDGLPTMTEIDGKLQDTVVTFDESNNQSPAGYYWTARVSENGGELTEGKAGGATVSDAEENLPDNAVVWFENSYNPGAELPATGGSGTLIYTIAGMALVVLAGVLLVSRRKRRT